MKISMPKMHKLIKTILIFHWVFTFAFYGLSQEESEGVLIREQKFKEAQQYKLQKQQFKESNNDSRYYNYKGKDKNKDRSRIKKKIPDYSYMNEPEEYQPIYNKDLTPEVVEYDLRSVEFRLTESNGGQWNRNTKENHSSPFSRIINLEGIDYTNKTNNKDINPENLNANYSNPLTVNPDGIVFKVQILAKTTRNTNTANLAHQYGIVKTVEEEYNQSVYRYVVGSFTNYNEATQYARYLQGRGIKDAFVVAYQNGIRTPVRNVLNN